MSLVAQQTVFSQQGDEPVSLCTACAFHDCNKLVSSNIKRCISPGVFVCRCCSEITFRVKSSHMSVLIKFS